MEAVTGDGHRADDVGAAREQVYTDDTPGMLGDDRGDRGVVGRDEPEERRLVRVLVGRHGRTSGTLPTKIFASVPETRPSTIAPRSFANDGLDGRVLGVADREPDRDHGRPLRSRRQLRGARLQRDRSGTPTFTNALPGGRRFAIRAGHEPVAGRSRRRRPYRTRRSRRNGWPRWVKASGSRWDSASRVPVGVARSRAVVEASGAGARATHVEQQRQEEKRTYQG